MMSKFTEGITNTSQRVWLLFFFLFLFLNEIIVTLSLPSVWINDESVVFGRPWLLIGADTYLKCFKYLCSCAIRGIQLSLRHLSDSVTGGSVWECSVWCGLRGTCAGRHGSCPVDVHVLSRYTAGNDWRREGFVSFVSFSSSLLSSHPSCLPSITEGQVGSGREVAGLSIRRTGQPPAGIRCTKTPGCDATRFVGSKFGGCSKGGRSR